MTLNNCVAACLSHDVKAFRRTAWPKGQHVRLVNHRFVFYRYIDSAITWNWSPTTEDALANDYEAVLIYIPQTDESPGAH
jgi:hypothetical protein